MRTTASPTLFASDLAMPEAPRWRHGRLYLSDMQAHQVVVLDGVTGERLSAWSLGQRPGGLGWARDGTMYVVGMDSRELLSRTADGFEHAADLSPFGPFANDMVIDGHDRAYIGMFGLGTGSTAAERVTNATTTPLVMVDLAASAAPAPRVVAENLLLPNGMVVTADETRLIVAESGAKLLTEFTIAADGSLSGRRVWAELTCLPDGICLDQEECVWAASPMQPGVFQRIAEGGEVVDSIESQGAAFACALGGETGRTLFLLEVVRGAPGAAPGQVRAVTVRSAAAGIL